MKFDPMSRRYFLQGLGSAIVTLPILPSLMPKAMAQIAPGANRRFICLAQDNGVYRPSWLPPIQNKSFMTKVGVGHSEMKLTDVIGPSPNAISQILGAEFANLRSKMILIENLDLVCPWDRGHQTASVLCGNMGRRWGPAKQQMASIDRVMARSSKIYPTTPRVDGLHLRVQQNVGEPEADLSWDYRNGGMVLPTVYDQPLAAFNAIFNITTPDTSGQQRAQKELLLVDQVLEQYKALRGNARAAAEDKAALDEHMQMLYDLQKQVQATASNGGTCTAIPTKPTRNFNNAAPADRSVLIDTFSAIMVAAIKCGVTKIGTLAISRSVDDLNYNSVVGINLGHGWHSQSHINDNTPEMLKIYRFYSGKVAAFLNALNTPEPGTNGTYLDNCIVYYGNGQSDGGHKYSNRPVLIAGGGGGVLQTNKYIDYAGYNNVGAYYGPAFVGRDYNQLLVTFLQAMGLSEADYYTAELKAKGVLPGYGDDRIRAGFKSDRRSPLPGLLK